MLAPVGNHLVAEPDHQCVSASWASSICGPCLCPGAWESAARTAAGPSGHVLLCGCNGADGSGEDMPALGRQVPLARPATDIGQDIQQHEPLPWPQRRQMEQMVGRDLDNLGIHAMWRVQGMLHVVIDEHPPSLPSRRPMPRGEGRGGPGRGKGAPEGEDGSVVAQRIRKGDNGSQAHLVPFLHARRPCDRSTACDTRMRMRKLKSDKELPKHAAVCYRSSMRRGPHEGRGWRAWPSEAHSPAL